MPKFWSSISPPDFPAANDAREIFDNVVLKGDEAFNPAFVGAGFA
jgi:hypothetical protein